MLDLTNTLRLYLFQTGALVYDDEEQEIFVGLTYAESEFIVKCSCCVRQLPAAERRLYNRLSELHIYARLRISKSELPFFEWQPGSYLWGPKYLQSSALAVARSMSHLNGLTAEHHADRTQ